MRSFLFALIKLPLIYIRQENEMRRIKFHFFILYKGPLE